MPAIQVEPMDRLRVGRACLRLAASNQTRPMIKLSAALTLALVAAAMPLTASQKKPAKPAAKAAAARPLPTEFMGVEIGSTFSMPECSTEDRGYGLPKSYAFEDKQAVRPCWNALAPDADYGRPKGENYTVEFMPPAGKRPPGVVTSSALVVNGKIEGVSFITNGLESQDSILSALTGKLGTPTQLKETRMQNRMGATFTSQEAVGLQGRQRLVRRHGWQDRPRYRLRVHGSRVGVRGSRLQRSAPELVLSARQSLSNFTGARPLQLRVRIPVELIARADKR